MPDDAAALHRAVWEENLNLVNELLNKNRQRKDFINVRKSDATALHFASKKGAKQVAELLIKQGADLEATDEEGETPLHWAATWNKPEIVELLVTNGANVNAKDRSLRTPIHDLRSKRCGEILLAHKANIHAKDKWGCTPLSSNTSRNNIDAV